MINNMIMKMRGDKCHPGRGKRGKIPLLPNNVGKKSVNEVGPQQGNDRSCITELLCSYPTWNNKIKVVSVVPSCFKLLGMSRSNNKQLLDKYPTRNYNFTFLYSNMLLGVHKKVVYQGFSRIVFFIFLFRLEEVIF